jgi:PAS domain S-box-containing protein
MDISACVQYRSTKNFEVVCLKNLAYFHNPGDIGRIMNSHHHFSSLRTVLQGISHIRWKYVLRAIPAILLSMRSSQIEAQPPLSMRLATLQVHSIIFLTAVSTILSIFLAVYAWRQRNKPGVPAFALMMAAIAVSSLAEGISMFSYTAESAKFWIKLNFLGIVTIPVFFLIFILQYSGRERWLSRLRIAMLFLIPLMTQIIIWTDDGHGFFFDQLEFSPYGSLMLLDAVRFGRWFRIHIGYTYLLTLTGIMVIISMIIRPFHLYRQQAAGLLLGIMPPILNSTLNASTLIPGIRSQLTLFSYTLMGSIFAWTLFHRQFLDVVPVARDILIDSMGDGMLVLDARHRIVDLNPAAQHLLNSTISSEYIGQSAFDVLQAWYGLGTLLQQDTHVQTEIALEHQGTQHHYLLRISPLTDKRGKQAGKLIMLRDITERKWAEEKLLEAHAELQEKNAQLHELNASKDKFFSIISHDLRGPFATLLGVSKLLEENAEAYPPDEIKKRVHWLRVYTKRLYTLLENLLTWSRLQRGAMLQQPELIHLFDIVEDNIALHAPKADEKEIVLTQTIPQQHLQAYADHSMINTVIQNLISNALKFTPAGGHVTVSAREQHNIVEVSVSDTGIGIPPREFSKLFRIDAQYTHSGTAGEKGSGLGLILCHELVERNGGTIWVESEVGKGTTFRFTLPCQKPEATATPHTEKSE